MTKDLKALGEALGEALGGGLWREALGEAQCTHDDMS